MEGLRRGKEQTKEAMIGVKGGMGGTARMEEDNRKRVGRRAREPHESWERIAVSDYSFIKCICFL